MAESDWTFQANGLDASNVARGVSAGFTPPNGGGSYVFAFNSLTNIAGAVAKATNQADFYPIAAGKGASVRGALQRNGLQECSKYLFALAQNTDISAPAYMLGLTGDEEPSHLALVKGTLNGGIPSSGTEVLRLSTQTFAQATWVHVRLDCIVKPHGDVALQIFASDLVNPVTAPDWQPVAGMAEYIDDVLGVLTGSVPYEGGYSGDGYHATQLGRYGFNDHVQVFRQL